ncbi:outer membrane protein assembly factor BamB [Legionella dresdenensis]|uniref:Outer membrane protein assembly factor BamB n=1 Tax=Legionella dresdenensis TaxID=450200 RepID=A0ABV8CBR4_9GAMM
MKKTVLSLALLAGLTSCSTVDDYMLGKDNTPAPSALEPITAKQKLKTKWDVVAGSTLKSTTFLKLKPVTVGNIIYTADASGIINAINKQNGNLVWNKKISSNIVSGPTVAAGHIAVGTDDAKIVILKESNGEEAWQTRVSSDVLSKPVIAHNKVIAKTIDGNLYAFDLNSGKQLWLTDHGSPSLILKASSSPIVVDNRLILVGYSDGKLDAVDIESGEVLWQRSIAYASGSSDVERLVDIDADPIVQGDTAYLASYQGYVGALSLANGEFVWRKPASTYKNIVIGGDTLYMTDSDDVVWALSKKTGKVSWKQVGLKARGLTEPVLSGNRLIIGDKTGMLHVLSTQNGEFLARTQLSGAIIIAPTVDNNNVYVMTANGRLNRISVS